VVHNFPFDCVPLFFIAGLSPFGCFCLSGMGSIKEPALMTRISQQNEKNLKEPVRAGRFFIDEDVLRCLL
jgi:hypothetical protein